VTLYAESSAVLRWILGEEGGDEVRLRLSEAGRVATSILTLVECDRAAARGAALGRFTAAEELDVRRLLAVASSRWQVMEVTEDVAARARAPFPREPVGTLDALHLATMLVFREALPDLRVLTCDERLRTNAGLLGLQTA